LYVCDGVAVQTRARGRKVGGGGVSDDHVRKAPRDAITFSSASAASSSASASVGSHRDPAPHLAVDLYRVLDGASTR